MPQAEFRSRFVFEERVEIDGDSSIEGIVTGHSWTSDGGHTVQVSWMHNGSSYSSWFPEHRLCSTVPSPSRRGAPTFPFPRD